MSFASAIRRKSDVVRPPGRVIEVPVTCWRETYSKRPGEPVKMGLRLLSFEDHELARSEATRIAITRHPSTSDMVSRVECFNDSLMRYCVARASCAPTNVHVDFFRTAPDDHVELAFRPEGVRFIWDELERYSIETSPVELEASKDEVRELAATIVAEDWSAQMRPIDAAAVRRLLRHCLRTIQTRAE